MNILVLTYWEFNDALIQTYTLPYIRIIKKYTKGDVFLITFESLKNGVSVEDQKSISGDLQKEGIIPVFYSYRSNVVFSFFSWIICIFKLRSLIRKNRIKVIHAWCTPAAVMAVILKKLNNNLVLNIDSFEPHAEAMIENGTWSAKSIKYKVLSFMEKVEAKHADNLVFAAPGMERYIKQKFGINIPKFYVKPACVNTDLFSSKMRKNDRMLEQLDINNKLICVYAGKFGGIYLEDETFAFIKQCVEYWGRDKFRFLLLSNVSDTYVKGMTSKYEIPQECITKLFVPHSEIPVYMGLADFAICPVKPVPSKKYCSPIKNGEYWALGLPVVITQDISIDSEIIAENNAGAVIETLDNAGYIKAIKKIDEIISPGSRMEIYNNIRPLAEKYRNFSIAEEVYKSLYASD